MVGAPDCSFPSSAPAVYDNNGTTNGAVEVLTPFVIEILPVPVEIE